MEKQLENVKVDLVSNSERQATIWHYHNILSSIVKERIIILNASLLRIPWKNKIPILVHKVKSHAHESLWHNTRNMLAWNSCKH
jgi:hypothetical protein